MKFQILALVAHLVIATRAALPLLDSYSVGDPKLKRMYCEMSQRKWINDDEALESLKSESNANVNAKFYFRQAMKEMKDKDCPRTMIKAECIAVVMYSLELYKDFNEKMRNENFESYNVLAALLHSAVVKLSTIPSVLTAYRGVQKIFKLPDEAFHFKQFTSISLKESTAKNFNGPGKLWKFEITPNSLVAKISEISSVKSEQELLISPFQAIQFVKEDKDYINFKTVESKIKCP